VIIKINPVDNKKTDVPQFPLRVLKWFCKPEYHADIEGDLLELYERHLEGSGKKRATWSLFKEVVKLFRPGIIRPIIIGQHLSTNTMYKSYFKIGLRNLMHARLFSIIKILGLSIGLTVCMLIFLFTKDEISYDQFHANKDQIYRITQNWQFGNDPPLVIGGTNAIVGESFAREIPEVLDYVRVNTDDITVKRGDAVFTENPLFVDSNFFSIFSFPLIDGDPATALNDLHDVVISKEIAQKYFGTTDVIGRTLELKIDDRSDIFTVTALAGSSPHNSSLKTDMLLPFLYYENHNSIKGWFGGSLNTFLLLARGADVRAAEKKMQTLLQKNIKERLDKVKEEKGVALNIKLRLQRLTDIHFDTKANSSHGLSDGSDPAYSYILSTIAVFILLIACINFINLTVAQSLKRSKEIGIRKVVGSTRPQLIRQFLAESLLVSSIAFVIAIVGTVAVIPFFNEFSGKKISISYLSDAYLYGSCASLLLVTAFTAGFYPSIVLSAFRPVKALYERPKIMGKNYFSKGLVVLQFSLSIFLIIGTVVINSQVNFLAHADLGYDSNNLVRIEIPGSTSGNPLPDLFRNELGNNHQIVDIGARQRGRHLTSVKVEGKIIEIDNNNIDDNFFPTFRIPIISGRNFSPQRRSDPIHSVIVNESFVREAGWNMNEAVGKTVSFMDDDNRQPVTVIGIVKDHHFVSLREKIRPALFSMNPDFSFGEIWVRIRPEDIPGTLSSLERSYKKLVPLFPYTYQFKDEINAWNYAAESKLKQIITIASGLFILISCMGLLGLVILSIEQRLKEIGIRKVLGAAVSRIVTLISKEFAIVICVSFVVALPAAYLVLDTWLQKFAYRITLHWWMFALAGALVMALALLIVCLLAVKAAMVNPVKSLRSE
jgi:putative ABC transport system permease protein